MKSKIVKLEEKEVEVNKISYGNLKGTIVDFVSIVNKLLNMMDNKDEDVAKVIFPFILENIDEVEKILFRFTNLDSESIKEVYIEEFVPIFKEIMIYNNINIEMLTSFFQKALNKQNPAMEIQE